MITKEEFAKKLNGRLVGEEITSSEENEAKQNNLVVVFGYSDDNTEFRGAIYDELGAFNGNKFLIYQNKKGWTAKDFDLVEEEYEEIDAEIPNGKILNAIWDEKKTKALWIFKTDIEHATFEIRDRDDEDGLFCIGIVFSINDLFSKKEIESSGGTTPKKFFADFGQRFRVSDVPLGMYPTESKRCKDHDTFFRGMRFAKSGNETKK